MFDNCLKLPKHITLRHRALRCGPLHHVGLPSESAAGANKSYQYPRRCNENESSSYFSLANKRSLVRSIY